MRKDRREAWEKWRGLVSQQQGSGQSVAAFCRERGISAPQLFAWKKRLSQAQIEQFVAVQVVEAGEPPQAPAAGTAIELRLNGGRTLIVEPGFDAGHLRALLAVLEARC